MVTIQNAESQVLGEISSLCTSPGYIHVLAKICYDYNFVIHKANEKINTVNREAPELHLVRQEISLLIAKMLQEKCNYDFQDEDTFQLQCIETKKIFEKLHKAIAQITEATTLEHFSLPTKEPFFYDGETAFEFQFVDIIEDKYFSDLSWFTENKGYSPKDMALIFNGIRDIILGKGENLKNKFSSSEIPSELLFECFKFTVEELQKYTLLYQETIIKVLSDFSIEKVDNKILKTNSCDYNPINTTPIIKLSEETYALFSMYSLAESMYSSPYYWMLDDKKYKHKAEKNRGIFTEQFCYEKLKSVFGEKNTFKNVIVKKSRDIVCEIDVLVYFLGYAIILQAKSKKLTVAARAGDKIKAENDFTKAIKESYNQSVLCEKYLLDKSSRFFVNDTEILIDVIEKTYILCVLQDKFPSLTVEMRHFIESELSEQASYPLGMDIFTLETFTEFLDTPLLLIDFLKKRTFLRNTIAIENEIISLSMYNHNGLNIADNIDFLLCDYSISNDINNCVLVRRFGAYGDRNPDGLIKLYHETKIGFILQQLEKRASPNCLELALKILNLSNKEIETLDEIIIKQSNNYKPNSSVQAITITNKDGLAFIFYCSPSTYKFRDIKLLELTECEKYSRKLQRVLAICYEPVSYKYSFMLDVNYPYEDTMQEIIDLCAQRMGRKKTTKIGRNDKCPCNSGKKYKKCCISK